MREMAEKRKNLQADKMLEQSNKRFKSAEEGENVNVPIPEVDRGRLDPPNFTDVIQEHDFWDRTLHFGDKSWNSEHTVLKKPIQPDEPKVPDNSDVLEDVTQKNANASGTLSSAIPAIIKIVVARIMTMPWSNKVIQRNPFPFYRVSSFIGSQKLVSACWGSNRLVPLIIPHHQNCNVHLYH